MRAFVSKVPTWVWWLVAVILVLGVGWMYLLDLNNSGKRVDQAFGDPVMGFTKKQWGGLLSGVVGAVVGGAVAGLVLLATIRSQWRQFEAEQAAIKAREDGKTAVEIVGRLRDCLDEMISSVSPRKSGITRVRSSHVPELMRIAEVIATLPPGERILGGVVADLMNIEVQLQNRDFRSKLDIEARRRIGQGLGKVQIELSTWNARNADQHLHDVAKMFVAIVDIGVVLREAGWEGRPLFSDVTGNGMFQAKRT